MLFLENVKKKKKATGREREIVGGFFKEHPSPWGMGL